MRSSISLRLGRKRIAHVSGPERFQAVRDRRDGYRKRSRRNGLLEPEGFYLPGVWSEGWGREAVAQLFRSSRVPPDAIFCGSDQIARGVTDALRERGIVVPDQVAIVGFDNWDIIAEATRPPLTSVDMNLKELGREAGRRLIDLIAGKEFRGVWRIPCTLVIRDSAARGAAAATDKRRHLMEQAATGRADAQPDRPASSGRTACAGSRRSISRTSPITGEFWRERLDTVLTKTIPSQHEQLEENGILDSLTIPEPPPPLRIPIRSHGLTTQVFWDSDVGKWIEIASYGLSFRRDETIERQIEDITDKLAAAQLPDGYLNCWYLGREIENRWTNLRDKHELYCAGHMLEGAIAYFDATGRRRLLDIMIRYVDHIAATFGTGAGPEARLLRAPGDRAGTGKTLPRHRRSKTPRSRRLFRRPARTPSRTISTSRHARAATIRPSIISRPTNTASRTSRCASRTRS